MGQYKNNKNQQYVVKHKKTCNNMLINEQIMSNTLRVQFKAKNVGVYSIIFRQITIWTTLQLFAKSSSYHVFQYKFIYYSYLIINGYHEFLAVFFVQLYYVY